MKMIISFVLFSILTIGTALAAPESQSENQNVQSCKIGIVDSKKIMTESPVVKEFQDELNQLGKELSNSLSAEKANLTPQEFRQKQKEEYDQFIKIKKEKESEIDLILQRSMEKVAKGKSLTILVYKDSINFGGLEITEDVMNNMIASPENQILNQSTQICTVGFIDISKTTESLNKVFLNEMNKKAKESIDKLDAERVNLTPEEFQQKEEEEYNELRRVEQEMEGDFDVKLHQAMEKAVKEKGLTMILHKKSVAWGGVDITLDVINNIEQI